MIDMKMHETTSPAIHIFAMQTAVHNWRHRTIQSKNHYARTKRKFTKGKSKTKVWSRDQESMTDHSSLKATGNRDMT